MPSKNPRINVVLDDNLYKNIQFLAETEGVSLSAKVKDLIKEALEVQEDLYLAALAEELRSSTAQFQIEQVNDVSAVHQQEPGRVDFCQVAAQLARTRVSQRGVVPAELDEYVDSEALLSAADGIHRK